MPPSAYDACPCGSGKKFKWCCAPYFDAVEKGMNLQQQGQHDAALAAMQALTKQYPTTPQVWGYYANILFAEGKIDEAEEAVDTAMKAQPDFPMGFLLRGLFRQAEGEAIGALMLFRKAAEAYSPDAHDHLAQVCEMIARTEIMLNRPVAARAVLEKAVHCQPGDAELREQFESLFGEPSRLPESARKKYAFRPMTVPLPAGAQTGKFGDAKKAFEAVAAAAPNDPAAWFNLGVVRAWLGEQPQAVDALNKSLAAEVDDYRAEETAALAEVLKCGAGMEADADFVEHRAILPIRDPEAVSALLQAWHGEGRLFGVQADPQTGYFGALVVEPIPSLLETGTTMARVVATMNIVNDAVRLTHPNAENVRKVATEIRDRVNLAVGEPTGGVGPVQFGDVSLPALAYPTRTANVTEAETKLRDHATNYFEGPWLTAPLKALGGANPVDAVGSSLMRKRLLGVIKFLADCLSGSSPRKQLDGKVVPIEVYDFRRLRHKLGIEMQAVEGPAPLPPEAVTAPAPAATAAPTADPATAAKPAKPFTEMNAAELAAIVKAEMSVGELEDAMRAAIKLDARELAVGFAAAGVAKPADAAKPDRYPLFACLMTAALADGKPADALAVAEAGAKFDAEHNGGKRANEFGLRSAALKLKTGDVPGAVAAFDALISANPDDGNFAVKAAEAMLGAKQGTHAAAFAAKGVEVAAATGNRDLDAACRELADAARRYV